jgi:predicted RNase H-like nuclease (RuvC/YqgF family)
MEQQSNKSLVEMELKYKKYKKKYQSLKRKISDGGGQQQKMKSKCREKQRSMGTSAQTTKEC